MMKKILLVMAFIILLLLTSIPIKAAGKKSSIKIAAGQQQTGLPQENDSGVRNAPETKILNQDGRELNFYRDLVKGKTVVINFVYTKCNGICPLQGKNFAALQKALGARLGHQVYLISISLDPVVDTPERLKEWGQHYGAKRGWTLVTGTAQNIAGLVKALTGDEPSRGVHANMMLIGNGKTGEWSREYGLKPPKEALKLLR